MWTKPRPIENANSVSSIVMNLRLGSPLCGRCCHAPRSLLSRDLLIRLGPGDFFLGPRSVPSDDPLSVFGACAEAPDPAFAGRRLGKSVAAAPSDGRFASRTRRHNEPPHQQTD